MTNTTNNSNSDNLLGGGSLSPITTILNNNTQDILDALSPAQEAEGQNIPDRIEDFIESVCKAYFGNMIQDANGNSIDLRNDGIGKNALKNIQSLKKFNIEYDTSIPFDINHPLFKLVICEPFLLNNVLTISSILDIKKDWHLARIEHAFFKGKNELFFHTELFEECIAYFGLEEIKNIFSYDSLPPTRADNRNLPHPASHKTIYQRMEQGCAIVDFCTHTGFKSGDHISARIFLDGVIEAELDNGAIHYLGSFAPEIRYFVEKIGISFDKLFALPAKTIATHCGILRSLQKFAYNRESRVIVKNFDIISGRKADEISLEEVFSKDNIFHYFASRYSVENLRNLFLFIQSNHPSHPIKELAVYTKISESAMLVEGAKNYAKIQNKIGTTSTLQNIMRDDVSISQEVPAFLSDENIHIAIQRQKDMQTILKDVILLDTINRDQILQGNQDIPNFLSDETLRETIKSYKKIIDITGSIPTIDRDNCLQNPSFVPSYLTKEDFLNLLYEYSCLKGYIENNSRFHHIDWNIYYQKPHLIGSLIEKIKKSVQSPLKNIGIITSLAQNLEINDQEHPLLDIGNRLENEIINTTDIKNKRKLTTLYRQMYEQHMGLYSIGGKIHVDRPISDDQIFQFLQDTGLKQTAFKLIHANTSVLLPPSYFASELMYMISRMGAYGLFADQTKPQLQISIPGRMPNNLGGILGSSMILLSQTHVEYTKESFDTTDNSHTGRRMVTYDAGMYDPTFERNSQTIKGRTDVLLLRDINLMSKAQIIGSLLSQTQYDGMFAELGVEFIQDYYTLLSKYGLDSMMDQPWIYDAKTAKDNDNLDLHFETVKTFTDRQKMDRIVFNATNNRKDMLVFALHELLQKYIEKIKSIQQRFK